MNIVSNCYNIGSVTGNTEIGSIIGANGAGIVDSKGGKITNCYYLSGTAKNACGINRNGSVSAVSKSQADMKNANMVTLLNNGKNYFIQDTKNKNNGYPVLTWMIDTVAPSITIDYDIKNLTNKNVVATIKADEEIQEIEGWTLENDKRTLTKEYTSNVNETVIVKDLEGNETQANIEIKNIDKTVPKVEVTYSTIELTGESVEVTITSNEEVQNITGWDLSSDKKTLKKEYPANTKETIIIKDLVGNETSVTIEINNIEEIQEGDINQDEKMDVTDFLMLKRHLVAGNRTEWELAGDALLSADMNENGIVDITDMLMLKRIVIENM